MLKQNSACRAVCHVIATLYQKLFLHVTIVTSYKRQHVYLVKLTQNVKVSAKLKEVKIQSKVLFFA